MSLDRQPVIVVTFWSGWRQPLTAVRGFEFWDTEGHKGTVPGELVLELVHQHLRQLAMMDAWKMKLALPIQEREAVIESPPLMVEKSTPRLRSTHGRKLKGR